MAYRTDDRLKDRVAIVTGAGSGLGRETALRFAASGAKVICADLKPTAHNHSLNTEENDSHMLAVDEQINNLYGPNRATFIQCDVTSEPSIQALISSAVEFGGQQRLDIMANYAGISTEQQSSTSADTPSPRLHELPIENYDKTMAINVRGVFLCCKHAISQFLSQEPLPLNARGDRTRGWIVNVASIYGLTACPRAACYVTSKHAVVGLTKQIAVDYAQDRIHCNALCPGFIDTPFLAKGRNSEGWMAHVKSLHPWGEIGTARDVAESALFLASDEAAWVSGHTMVIDGGYTAK